MGTYTFVHRLFQIVRNLERPPKPERHAGADSWVQLYPRKWKQTTSGSKQQQALENEPHIYFWVQRVLVLPPGPKQWKQKRRWPKARMPHPFVRRLSGEPKSFRQRRDSRVQPMRRTPGCSSQLVLICGDCVACVFESWVRRFFVK